MKLLLALLLFAAVTIFYTSCNKSDIQNPDPETIDSTAIMGFKDSTQLIKSFTSIHYDNNGVITDSFTTTVSYDTLLRKISLHSGASGVTIEHSYNDKGLLTHIETSGYPSGDYSFDYTYDASNIIKTAAYNAPGDHYVYSIEKTLLSSGSYQLNWLDSHNQSGDNYFTVNFDSSGKLIFYYQSDHLLSDSIIYDARGNVSKVLMTRYLSPDDNNNSSTITLYDFVDRDTKGAQLYNLIHVLYNGVANIPPEISGFGPDTNMDFLYQIYKYPVHSTNINRPDGDAYCMGCPVHLVTFNNAPEFDSKNRLVRYSVFTNDEFVYRNDIVIRYYKNV